MYGCPHGAKWNGRHFVDEALEMGAQITNGAKVKKINTNSLYSLNNGQNI
jgi:hypothetical protein